MSAYLFALIAVTTQALKQVTMRACLRSGADIWPVLVSYNLLGAMIVCFLVDIPVVEVVSLHTLALVLLVNFLWIAICIFELKAHQHLDVAIGGVLQTVNFILVVLGGVLLFNERMSPPAILAAALVVASAIRLTSTDARPEPGAWFSRGVRYKLSAVVLLAVNMLLTKYLTTVFPPMLLAILGFYIPTIGFALIKPASIRAIPGAIRESRGKMLAIPVFSALSFSSLLRALELGHVSTTYAIMQTGVVAAFIFGVLLLGERENLMRRGVSCALCSVGAFIVCNY